eukprot:5871849-Lingulodinium_polyedra.AAC.1
MCITESPVAGASTGAPSAPATEAGAYNASSCGKDDYHTSSREDDYNTASYCENYDVGGVRPVAS